MFNVFKTRYNDEELFQALKKNGIAVTEHEIQKARQNDPETLYNIGNIYFRKEIYGKAFPWFHKAALQNHAEAQAKVGWMYRLGEGVTEDSKQARKWSMKAASAGNAEAQYRVGELYHYGWGVSIDKKQAMNCNLKAANNGNTDAMRPTNWTHHNRRHVTPNIHASTEWSTKAANNGNTDAMRPIGWTHHNRRHVTPNIHASTEWYTKAANNGNTDAMRPIGWTHHNRRRVTPNIHASTEWYTKAANQGNAETQYELGDIYQNEDQEPDLQKAVNWYQKAADNNYYRAKEEVKELNAKGYYAKEEEQEQKEQKTRKEDAATTNIANVQSQSSITTSNNGDHFNKLMQSRMDHLEKTFQSKMALMKGNNDALQNKLAALRQKELQQDQENKQLRDELTKLKVATEDSINNDLNYDSSDNEGDDNTDTADVGVMQGSDDALQKELAALKQSKLEQHAENQRLKEKLARMEAAMQNNADNGLNYDSSVNESDNENDINYDSEYSDSKEEEDNKDVENTQKPLPIHPNMDESHADPNYNSSDNKDPRNDIYYD